MELILTSKQRMMENKGNWKKPKKGKGKTEAVQKRVGRPWRWQKGGRAKESNKETHKHKKQHKDIDYEQGNDGEGKKGKEMGNRGGKRTEKEKQGNNDSER